MNTIHIHLTMHFNSRMYTSNSVAKKIKRACIYVINYKKSQYLPETLNTSAKINLIYHNFIEIYFLHKNIKYYVKK